MVCFVLFDTKLTRFYCIRRGSKSRRGCGRRRRCQDQRHYNQQQDTSHCSISFLFTVAFCVRNYGLGTQSSDQPRGWLSRIERRGLLSTDRLNLRAQSAARKGQQLLAEEAAEYASIHELPRMGASRLLGFRGMEFSETRCLKNEV